MSFEYIEIRDKLFIPDCVKVHKRIFQLSDVDSFPPAFFTMLIRKEHPLGIVIGCFKKENDKVELIGIAVTVASINENSVYCPLVGVLPEYQNGRHGYMFALKLRETALKRGITKVFGIYDPLEANLGKLYSYIGGITTTYIQEPYTLNNIDAGIDKVLYEWQLDSEHVNNKMQHKKIIDFKDFICRFKIVQTSEVYDDEFLFEIPNNYLELKNSNTEEANKWRKHTRSFLSKYLNNEGYIISECLSGTLNGSKKTYYLLSNKFKNESFSQSNFSFN